MVACYNRKSLPYNHETSFCRNIESIFIDIFLPKLKPILVGVLHNFLKERNICNTQDCYLQGDFNVDLLFGKNALEKTIFWLLQPDSSHS